MCTFSKPKKCEIHRDDEHTAYWCAILSFKALFDMHKICPPFLFEELHYHHLHSEIKYFKLVSVCKNYQKNNTKHHNI